MYMTASFGLKLLYMAYYIEAYSTGAPESACETLIPVHEISKSRLLPTQQFYANLSSATYCPGEDIHVHIYGTSEGYVDFKGFLCQAHMTGIPIETVHEAGILTSADPYQNLSCPMFPSVTHVSNTWKTDINLIWTHISSVTTAEIQIVCTIVIDYSTYILDITTPWISYGQGECTSGVDSESSPLLLCEEGMYYNLTQQTCFMCPAGYLCPENTTAYEEYPCPQGYYCPEGTTNLLPCPLGTYRAEMSGTQLSDCLPCPCGLYCDSIALTFPTGDCNAGYFCIKGAVSATPTDGVTGDICSPESFCPTGSCKETACIEGDNCASTASADATTSSVERTTNLTTAKEETTASVERTTNLTTSTEATTASVERTTNLTTSTEATTASVERTTNLATSAEATTESIEGTTTQAITNPCDCLLPDPPQNGDVDIVSDERVQAVFTCDVGYEFEFPEISNEWSYVIPCSCGEWLGFTNVTCVPIDCGGNATLDNGYIYYGDGTTYGAASVFICNIGYQLDGLSSAVCMASGQWSRPIPNCVLVDCGLPREPINGFILDPPANSTIDTTFNSIITYECNSGFLLEGHKSRRCLSSGDWSGHIPLCIKVLEAKSEPCETHVDNRGTVWHTSPPGMVSIKSCSNGYQGTISRNCTVRGQWLLPNYHCVRETLDEITKLVEGATVNPSGSLVSTILTNLSQVTTPGADDVLYDGELRVVTTTLENIVAISQNITIDDRQKQNFIRTASNLVDKKNIDSWKAINQETEIDNDIENGPAGVLRAVAGYSEVIANITTSVIEIKEPNIAFRVANYTNDIVGDIRFPAPALAEELQTSSFYCLSNASLEGVKQYSTVFYKNLTEILPTSTSKNYSRYEINGAILSLKLIPYKNHLESPLELHFQHFNTFYKNPVCSYWNFESNGWDNEGCTMTSTDSEVTSCKCTHLTNFAILMSPYKQDVSKALNIISITGCGISLIGLALTVVLHVAFWRYVKSERAILVLCLSAALIIFNIIFIAGVERTDNKDACTTIAVLLHYCLLVVFFMMLAASVQIAFSVLYVFGTKVKKIKWLLPIALGVPAVIVTISASVTKLDGYGTDEYCWLATDGGVIWAFIGPALFVMCVNIILLILILKTMHSTKLVSQKSGADKIKSTVKCLCVLLPVMGVTWILGLFYVNDDTNWIQYLFAICNSIQGLVIFVFHCALNKQIHKAFLLTKRRYSVETSESRLANQMKKIRMKDTL